MNRYSNLIYIELITETEIEKIVCNLKNNKSSDIYGITVEVVKNILNNIKEPLARLMDKCLELGLILKVLKKTKIRANIQKG